MPDDHLYRFGEDRPAHNDIRFELVKKHFSAACGRDSAYLVKNFAGRGQLLIRAREETVDLRPVNRVRF